MSERRHPPDHRDPRAKDGLRWRRAERNLPVDETARATYATLTSGLYAGIIVQGGKRVWRCEHSHYRPVGEDRHGRPTPVFRSASKCAQVELARRAAL